MSLDLQQVAQQLAAGIVGSTNLAASNGAGLVGTSDTTLALSLKNTLSRVVDSISLLRATDSTKYSRAFVTGYYVASDGGGGNYYVNTSDNSSSDNGGTIIVGNDGARWYLANVGAEINAKTFGATGSSNTVLATTTAASTVVTLSAAGDFYNGQNVVIYNAGAACTLVAPTGITVTPTGTAGSTTYTYYIVALDGLGGATTISAAGTTATGNATLSATNYNAIAWTASTSAVEYAIYKNGVGLVGLSTTTSFNDVGYGVIGPVNYIQSSVPSTPQAQTYYGSIVSGGGTTSIVVTPATISATASHTMLHNDTAAINNALTVANRTVNLPAGTYRVNHIVCNGKNLRGKDKRESSLVGIDKTQPVIQSYNISQVTGLSINHGNFSIYDTFPNCIGLQLGSASAFSERTSKFEDLLVTNCTEGISTTYTAYSNIFRNIELSRCILPIHMNCPSATGNLFDNIYIDNWDNFNSSIKMNSKWLMLFEGSWSESTFRQINCEWSNVSVAAILCNGFDNCTFESTHFEGLTFTGSPNSAFSFIANSGSSRPLTANILSTTFYGNTLATSSVGVGFVSINGYCRIFVSGASGTNNTANSGTTWIVYRGGTVGTPNPEVFFANAVAIDIFTQGSFAPVATGQPAIIKATPPLLGDTAPTASSTSGTYQLIQHPSKNSGLFFAYNGTNWYQYAPYYEEGTFTPAFIGATTAGTFTYTIANGWYKRVGSLVTFGGVIQASNMSVAPTGNAQISLGAIPYSTPNSSNGYTSVAVTPISGLTSPTSGVVGSMIANSSVVALNYDNGAGYVSGSVFSASTYIMFSGSFSAD